MNSNDNKSRIKETDLNLFLKQWPRQRISNLKIKDYVLGGTNTRNTFSYWLEETTSSLGSIGGVGGGGAFRYGIFIQKNKKKYLKKSKYLTDGKYAWNKVLGNTPGKAFRKIKKDILYIIDNTRRGKFDKIDHGDSIFTTVRWKIAYLYSNGVLVPFYSLALLKKIAKELGHTSVEGLTHLELQTYISVNRAKKYPGMTVLEFGTLMGERFGKLSNTKNIVNNDPYIFGYEGKLRKTLKVHLVRERSADFRNKFKKKFLYIVSCPACKFNAKNKYGLKNPHKILEMHHIVPFNQLKKETKITEKDVMLLCPNCHRAIHKMMTEENKMKINMVYFKKRIR